MSHVLISYDVSTNQIQMKALLKAAPYNYLETITIGNINFNLPTTTLWKTGITSSQAKIDMLNAAKSLNITVTKAIAVDFTTAGGIP